MSSSALVKNPKMNNSQRGLSFRKPISEVENDELNRNLRQAFELYDKDNSGFLDEAEIKEAMRALGVSDSEKAKSYFKEYDRNNDGKIDYEEFVEMMTSKVYTRDLVEDIFDYFQPDKNNKITRGSLEKVAKQYFKHITKLELEHMFVTATKNDDGITDKEFQRLYESYVNASFGNP